MVDIEGGKNYSIYDSRYVNLSGDIMTGLLTLSGAPVADLHAATKKYVDDAKTPPGGVDTYVQFNDNGVFGGDSGLIYNKASKTLTTTNIITDSITMDIDEVITQNSETIKHDGTHHTFSDSISCGGNSSGQSIIASGLVVNDGGGGAAQDDFRVETTSEPNAFVVDASANEIPVKVPMKIGDGGTTNYTEIKADGSMEFHGNARTNKSIWIQSESLRAPGTNGATFTDAGITGAWEFADNVTRYVVCKFPLRTDIDRTEDIELVLGWFSPATSGNCKWQLEYLLRGEDEDMTVAAESAETQAVAPSTTANGLVLTTFTVSAANISDTDHCILIRIARVGGDADDTMSDSAYLSGVCFQFVSDKIGGIMI